MFAIQGSSIAGWICPAVSIAREVTACSPGEGLSQSRDHIFHANSDTSLRSIVAGAAQVLGPDHGVTKALGRAAITMAKVDLWHARVAIKTLRLEQREAIAGVGEG